MSYWHELEREYAEIKAELEQLHKRIERYEQPNIKCGKGHINTLPLSLWDCPVCTEEMRQELKALNELKKDAIALTDALDSDGTWWDSAERIKLNATIAQIKSKNKDNRKTRSEKPKCFTPNNDPYPLCKGNENNEHDCKLCNLYEDMEEGIYGD